MSSISRRRNGLTALSVIGGSCLGCVFSPSISRQDACFCYSPRPFPSYKLPRKRFSPSALGRRRGRLQQGPLIDSTTTIAPRRRTPLFVSDCEVYGAPALRSSVAVRDTAGVVFGGQAAPIFVATLTQSVPRRLVTGRSTIRIAAPLFSRSA